jgi:uncharacterized protein YjbI with pentapeptide repeats
MDKVALVADIKARGGAIAIAEWRKANPEPSEDDEFVPSPRLDLSGCDLREADFTDADLSGAVLVYTQLDDARFTNANLEYAKLYGAMARNADLTNANLTHADLRFLKAGRARFDRAILDHVNVRQGNFVDAICDGISGKYLNAAYANFQNTRFSDAVIEFADFRSVRMIGATFKLAQLTDVRFGRAKLNAEAFAGAIVKNCSTTKPTIARLVPGLEFHSASGRVDPPLPNPFDKRRRR